MPRGVEEIRDALAAFLAEEGPALGLGEGPFRIDYVPNPGGLVNANFTVAGPSGRWHCKLAGPGELAGHRRWWDVRAPLTERYRAPRLLAWIDVEGASLEGTISEHLAGRTASWAVDDDLWPAVHERVRALHADAELTDALAPTAPGGSCREYLESTWLSMLETDVAETRGHPSEPRFVDGAFWDWSLDQVERIRRLAADHGAFDEPADALVHGDLWEGNLLVHEGAWRILDWDDLGPGDPVKDVADWWYAAEVSPPPSSPSVDARLPLWLRTRLLVDVVDPLADWSEADAAPAGVRAAMRRAWRRVHEDALRAYEARYGDRG